ncbi:MAG: hypothetical protein NC336_06580 [Clostridium sp.]|nr:hypothetical protein [Clostridium sp.]
MEQNRTEQKRTDLLAASRRYWEALADFRQRRERHKRYAFGNQWGDPIEVDGKVMTEEEMIRSEGATPLKNNFINRFLRNIVGVYRSQAKEPTCVARDRSEAGLSETMSTVLQYNWQLNHMGELLAAVMKEFLISGAAIVRKSWGRRNGKTDCWTDIVSPRRFFVDDRMTDIRGWDISAVGELKDLTFADLVAEFAVSGEDISRLRRIYTPGAGAAADGRFGIERRLQADSFLQPDDPSLCRVIELWSRERRPRYLCHDRCSAELYSVEASDYDRLVAGENRRRRQAGEEEIESRWIVDEVWVYRCLAPDGTLLRETLSPYAHGGHPYVFKFHPFIDGEIHSFIEDVIDQQRYVNRLVSLYDWTIRASAKGVLLFPEKCLPSGMTLEDVGNEWARYNGILPIRNNPDGPEPRQISGGAGPAGIGELLSLQLRFLDEISGVNGALQGKPGNSGMSASLYAQQTQNATLSLLDLLESFSSFVVEGAYMDVKNIQQFYDTGRVVTISGATPREARKAIYDPEAIRDIEFDLAIMETTTTGVYRQLANDYLRQLWSAGAITAEQFLRFGDFPYSRELADELTAAGKKQTEFETETENL